MPEKLKKDNDWEFKQIKHQELFEKLQLEFAKELARSQMKTMKFSSAGY